MLIILKNLASLIPTFYLHTKVHARLGHWLQKVDVTGIRLIQLQRQAQPSQTGCAKSLQRLVHSQPLLLPSHFSGFCPSQVHAMSSQEVPFTCRIWFIKCSSWFCFLPPHSKVKHLGSELLELFLTTYLQM